MNRRAIRRFGMIIGLGIPLLGLPASSLTQVNGQQPAQLPAWPASGSTLPIAAPASLEKIFTGATFTEGPALGPDGAIYFSDIPSSRIHRHDPATGQTTLHQSNTGQANGLAFDAAGRLIACRGQARDVARLQADGSWSVLTPACDGRPLNCPNDLAIAHDGSIYFTDPRYRKPLPDDPPVEGVYRQPADGSPCRLILSDLAKPNGIALSHDQKHLFVADWKGEKVVRYALPLDDSPKPQLTYAAPNDFPARFMPDGIKVDRDNRLYATSPAATLAEKGGGGVWVFDPQGQLVSIHLMPENPTNLLIVRLNDQAWLYVTAQKSLYRMPLSP